ncbi:MAG: YdcF family protein [Alphaproteobacteria bacterium]|nr:YdcF family protein [Alphaproteobacteria bacterium]
MSIDGIMILGKELRRYPQRARRELRARAAAASVAVREGARVVFTLEACLRGQPLSGSRIVADMLAELGVPVGRIVLGERTRSTREEALEGLAGARAHGLRRLGVITASYHLPRARRYFEEVFPVGHVTVVTPEAFLQRARGLERRWILEGIPDAAVMRQERPIELALSAVGAALAPLPEPLRWQVEVRTGALYRQVSGD